MSETILQGGDVNLVERVVDTVRRPPGPWRPALHALLRHVEDVGNGRPVALIDCDLARRADDVAMVASWWTPLQPDEDSARWGSPLDPRGERSRLVCDGYGLEDRSDYVDRLITLRGAAIRSDAARNPRARRHIRPLEEHWRRLEAWL